MTSAQKNLAQVKQQIQGAMSANNRREDSVTLLAVSKTKPVRAIQEFIALGVRDFGENYLQEAAEKIVEIDNQDVRWHFIGAIQSRKCEQIAQLFQWVHSVDRIKVAKKLNQYAPQPLNVCIQVNIDNEISKAGVTVDELPALLEECQHLDKLIVRGIMIIPNHSQLDQHPNAFERAKSLLTAMKERFPCLPLDHLSMGMSADLEQAIAAGSNCVRIGTALFGARDVK